MNGKEELVSEYYTSEDFCSLCAEERREQGLAPHIKIKLPNTTSRRHLVVAVCPTCDGPTLDLGVLSLDKI